MITCELIGRCGNNAFIIAATIAAALRNDQEYHIPKHTKNDALWPPVFDWLNNNKFNTRLLNLDKSEVSHGFEPIFTRDKPDVKRNYTIKGYRQSYKYFENEIDEVRKAMRFDLPSIMDNVCGIHVRRGDYLNLQPYHPVCPLTYYHEAVIKHIPNTCAGFLVFSDDIEWCKAHFVGEQYHFSEGKTELEDIRLLSQCQYQIIANSSFSLFAALMNNHKYKIVISPSTGNWFGPKNKGLDVSDLLPDSFIQIAY